MDVELTWEDKDTVVERPKLPFQTIETINHPRGQAPLFDSDWPDNYPRDWKNKLIWGDNQYVMSSLLDEFAGEIDLIYIDPPFATGADFSYNIKIGDKSFKKQPSVIEKFAYRDTWKQGIKSYLEMMYDRLVLMRELLAKNGTILVHSDWRANAHLKLILDEIFGRENQINEIVWCYKSGGIPNDNLPKKHDTIHWYAKGDEWTFNPRYTGYTEGTRERGLTEVKDDNYELSDEGARKPDWWFIQPILSPTAHERTGYPTQKPEELLKEIIQMASCSGDLVGDFFCGSGTTAAVAEKLGRRWIASDLSRHAIQTTRTRLLNITGYSDDHEEPARPFKILNLGQYAKRKFVENDHEDDDIGFVLDVYGATRLREYAAFNGMTGGGRAVRVESVSSNVTASSVHNAAEEAEEAGFDSLDVLGWEFEMGVDEIAQEVADQVGIDIRLLQIPDDVLELDSPTSTAAQEIRFFDLNYVEVGVEADGREVRISLDDFILNNRDYLPDEARERIDNEIDLVDYWAVDFDYDGETFHNEWQSFRTDDSPSITRWRRHVYDEPGEYDVLVKVVDVFGNDTNELVTVEVKDQ
jgi:DNA modification methylase